jgi:hypothetical protein
MLKKIVLASVAALGLGLPFAATPAANAAHHDEFEYRRYYYREGPEYRHHHHRCYEVLFRDSCDEPWRCRGTYESRHRAYEVAERLRCRGFEVRIVVR